MSPADLGCAFRAHFPALVPDGAERPVDLLRPAGPPSRDELASLAIGAGP